jgi:glycosyltransferase involved in cell wall biosynthesis
MKVAVYSISKNEEQFIKRWAESAKDADLILLADTGSTDKTVEIAKECGVEVVEFKIDPWRFDHARNASLDAIPEDFDYCVALDVDEVLLPGWREELEKMHEQGIMRVRYQYTWSWKEDGSPGLQYGGDKIHTRKDYVWRHPVHEVLHSTKPEVQGWCGLEIHHHPDHTKSRSSYLPLLELSVQEDPDDDRNAFYFARELFFYNQWDRAAAEFKRHLALPRAVWKPERARSMRYLAIIEENERENWLLKACAEAPDRREGWVELSLYHFMKEEWEQSLAAAVRALSITEKPLEYLCEEFAWGSDPYDLAAVACHHLGLSERAIRYGEQALEYAPEDERLIGNLELYRARNV